MSTPSFSDSDAEHELTKAAWLHRLALAVVRDVHQAEDIAQEAWIVGRRHSPATVDKSAGWFVQVIRNLARFKARTDARRAVHERLGAQPESAEDPTLSIERLELQEELLRAVRALPEPYRTTVLQRWFEELEPHEIARRAGVSVSTVHTRTARALDSLREHLDRRSGGDRTSWTQAWMPLVGSAGKQHLSILAVNLKIKLALAAGLVLALLTTVWIAIPELPNELAASAELHARAPLTPEHSADSVASSAEGEPARTPIEVAKSKPPPASAASSGILVVRVKDALGPIDRYAIRTVDPAHPDRLKGIESAQEFHRDGASTLRLDRETFFVQIYADLHVPLVLGPYDRATCAATLEAKLERLAGIRGRVVRQGAPVEGALVSLHEVIRPGRREWAKGLLERSHNSETAKGTSGENGAFVLTLQKAGQFFIRARLAGWASAELGPFDLDPKAGKDGIVLEISQGGSIEGQVLLPPGMELAKTRVPGMDLGDGHRFPDADVPFEVVATRGDGFPHRMQPDAQGHFRMDGLSPGRWCLMRQPPVSMGGTEGDDGPGETPAWSNCEVLEGVVTHQDLDLRSGPGVHLAISAQVGGSACSGWRVRVASYGWRGAQLDEDTNLGPDGRLEVECLPGPTVLHMTCSPQRKTTFDLREQVTFEPGDATWTINLAAGSVECGVAENGLGKGSPVELRWSDAKRDALYTARVGEHGRFTADGLPVGSWKATNPKDPTAPAIPFVVRAGETTHVDLRW